MTPSTAPPHFIDSPNQSNLLSLIPGELPVDGPRSIDNTPENPYPPLTESGPPIPPTSPKEETEEERFDQWEKRTQANAYAKLLEKEGMTPLDPETDDKSQRISNIITDNSLPPNRDLAFSGFSECLLHEFGRDPDSDENQTVDAGHTHTPNQGTQTSDSPAPTNTELSSEKPSQHVDETTTSYENQSADAEHTHPSSQEPQTPECSCFVQ